MKLKLFGFGALVALCVPVVALGAVYKVGDNPGVRADETINDDMYAGGGSVLVAGPVTGDVYAGGGTVVVSAPVGADLAAGGGTVLVTGTVADDVRAGGGTVTLQGAVGGDVLVGGGQVTIAGQVGGDVWVGGGAVRIEAPVAGEVRVGGGEVYINAAVTGPIEVDAEKLTLGPNAVLNGALSYRSPQEMVREEGARIVGQVTYEPREERGNGAAFAAAAFTAWFVLKTLMLLAFALVLGLVFRRYAATAVHAAARSPWLELLRGLVTVIVLPVISFILLATVVGVPFGILGLVALVALMLAGWGMAAILMGSLAYRLVAKGDYVVNWKTILIGVVLYSVLSIIPFVGWIINLLFVLAAVGTVVGIKWQVAKEWR